MDEYVAPSATALARIRYRFQGREWSAVTGLINFRMRWYDAVTGRWLSKDPIGLSGGLNLYVFCGVDPANGVDAFGAKSNIPIPGTHYVGRVETLPIQNIPNVWHVDVEYPRTGAKVWSGVFNGDGEYIGGREGYSSSDISNGDLEAIKKWAGPKIRKQAGALPSKPYPPAKGGGGCGRGGRPAGGGFGGGRPAGGGFGGGRPAGGGGGGGYGPFVSPYLM